MLCYNVLSAKEYLNFNKNILEVERNFSIFRRKKKPQTNTTKQAPNLMTVIQSEISVCLQTWHFSA